jgi:hypothetical protein
MSPHPLLKLYAICSDLTDKDGPIRAGCCELAAIRTESYSPTDAWLHRDWRQRLGSETVAHLPQDQLAIRSDTR